MIVSHKHKFILVRSKKTASTSVETALSTILEPTDVFTGVFQTEEGKWSVIPKQNCLNAASRKVHQQPNMIRDLYIEKGKWDEYQKVSITRNPWDRLISWFWYAKTRSGYNGPADFDAFVLSNIWKEHTDRDSLSLQPIMYWCKLDGQYCIDRMIRFENLYEDVALFGESLGVDLPLLNRMKCKFRKDRRHYTKVYSPKLAKMVADYYAEDIERFNYTFD